MDSAWAHHEGATTQNNSRNVTPLVWKGETDVFEDDGAMERSGSDADI